MGTVWSYSSAFIRNLGLVLPWEQAWLRESRVAIAGMGGVGGVELITLARLGIGNFTIADPDVFEVKNINRQYGATVRTLGRQKVNVMAELVREVNPEVNVRVLTNPIDGINADYFLDGADLFVDAIDAFEIDARRVIFRRAAQLGIPAITAGPLGFSTAWLIFRPDGMSFDRYFDLSDGMEWIDKFVSFIVGVAPRATHRRYMDVSRVNLSTHVGPSCSSACQLAAGVVGSEAVKIMLERGKIRAVPWYHQFDPSLNRYVSGYLWAGNRHPLQRLRRWVLKRTLLKLCSSRSVEAQDVASVRGAA